MASGSGIPLHCNICPKKPTFSDVSHLLTHIASKGHLSHYYKTKVRSATEDASRELVEAYDRWYIEWGVEDLMSERISFKDKKRPRARATGRSSQTPAGTPSMQPQTKTRGPFDPRLADMAVKAEPRATPPPMFNAMGLNPFSTRMQFWRSASPSSFGNASTDYDWLNDGSDLYDSRTVYHPSTASTSANTSAIMDDNEEAAVSECTKLKGVYWPGMDIFDSATPEMRRKRNQKKDTSVLEQLELNSKEVEPTELVFTPSGSFKRRRRISGSTLDDSSPLKEELSPKAPRFIRPALTELDPNRQDHKRAGNRPPQMGSLLGVADDDQLDFKSSFGDFGRPRRKRRTFDVFQDQNIIYNQPPTFNYLASEFRYQQPADQSNARVATRHPHAPKWQYDDKENYGAIAYQYANYYPHQGPAYSQNPLSHAPLGQDVNSTLFTNPFQAFSTYQPLEPDMDDQVTITAPPSEI